MQNIYANFNIFQLLDTSLLLYSTIFENISLEISSIFFIESINLLNLTINIENCQFSEILGNFPIFFRLDYQNIKISTTYFAYNEAGNFLLINIIKTIHDRIRFYPPKRMTIINIQEYNTLELGGFKPFENS